MECSLGVAHAVLWTIQSCASPDGKTCGGWQAADDNGYLVVASVKTGYLSNGLD